MKRNSRDEPNGVSPDWVKEQLRALCAVEPPTGLKERLLAGLPCQSRDGVSPDDIRWWLGVTGWAGIAATIVLLWTVSWLGGPAKPSVGPEPDASEGMGLVLAVDYNNNLARKLVFDYNSLRPSEVNTRDSNGLQ